MPEDTKGHRLASIFPTPDFFESTNIFTAEQIILRIRDVDSFAVQGDITGSGQFYAYTTSGWMFAKGTLKKSDVTAEDENRIWKSYAFSIAGSVAQGAIGEFEDVARFAGWDHAKIELFGAGPGSYFVVVLSKALRRS